MAEAELKGLGGEFEVALLQVELGHEQVSLCVRGTLVQAVLQAALGCFNVT